MNILKNINCLFRKNDSYYSSSYYHQLVDKYSYNLIAYNLLSNSIKTNQNKLNTNIQILVDSSINFNSTILDIKKKYGAPINKIENKVVNNVIILFYKLKIANQNAKCEFHFYNKKLFYIRYSFSCLNEEKEKSAISVLEKKYLVNTKFDYENQIIIDSLNNVLFINKGINFNIDYVATNSIFFHEITNFKRENNVKMNRKILFENELSYRL